MAQKFMYKRISLSLFIVFLCESLLKFNSLPPMPCTASSVSQRNGVSDCERLRMPRTSPAKLREPAGFGQSMRGISDKSRVKWGPSLAPVSLGSFGDFQRGDNVLINVCKRRELNNLVFIPT